MNAQKVLSRATSLAIVFIMLFGFATLTSSTASALQPIDEEVPPGNPVIGDDRPGDNPVLGDFGPGQNETNYVLWGIVGICLIGAGTLLVKLERWEARRVPE